MIEKVRGERQKSAEKKVEDRKRKRQKEKEKVEDMPRKTVEKGRKQKTGKGEHRKRKRLKRIGCGKTKMTKYMFHLENRQQQRKEGRKQRN